MISVTEALAHLFALTPQLPVEHVPLRAAAGRTLAQDVQAQRTQPPFAASAMDGYALRNDEAKPGAQFHVIGESAAGHRFQGNIQPGQAVRIFTGAPVPTGADRVIIQEDVTRQGDHITLNNNLDQQTYIRAAGQDFSAGEAITAPRTLRPADIALLAAMNIATVPVTRKPVVAIIPTGDELVQPGEAPSMDQIIASNSYGLAALLEDLGASPRLLPIAQDSATSLALTFDLAQSADLIITIGGASVGDHDLVGQVAGDKGMEQAFYKIAMRPGKPLMAGKMGGAMMIGLPGNPVSAMVCGHVFVAPVIRAMLGHKADATPTQTATLAHDIGPNGPRAHYMRGHLGSEGLQVFDRQDSALLSVLARANCLAIRPPNDRARPKGDQLQIIQL